MSLVSPKFGIRPRLQRIQGSGLASPGCLTQPLCDRMSTDGLLIGSTKSSLIAFRITKEINEKKAHYCTWCYKRRFSRNVCELYRIWASLVRLFFSFHIVASIAEWCFFKIYRRIIQNLWYFQYWEVKLLKCPLFIGNKKKRPSGISSIKLLWQGYSYGETLPQMCQPVKGKTENSGAMPTQNIKNPVISSFIFWWSHIFILGKFSMSFNLLMILSSTPNHSHLMTHSIHQKSEVPTMPIPGCWARDGNFPLLGMVPSLEGTQVSLFSQRCDCSNCFTALHSLSDFSLPSTHNTEGQYILQPGHKSSHCRKLTPGMRCHR